ncbi:MAG: protein translocase subunit SecF [Clostridiales bacterium]|jgi:preprotein translocase SecF subunit|nr:protein translocase subunit SecF [Clostridiales bacterium]MDR2749331.1 protein translocase subunit SecF [Clostridiales bacterium]
MRIVENRFRYITGSLVALALGIAFMIINGVSGNGPFNLDVEFSGGTSFQIEIGQEFNNDDIAAITKEITGQAAPQIQKVAGGDQVLIRMRSIDQATRISLIEKFKTQYSLEDSAFTYSDISPTISADMQRAAVMAVIVACAAMLVYISIRFRDIRMGAASIMALLHDALVMIAFYAILRIPLNYSFIAAVLTILGYSINATIVLFDRIRENRTRLRKVSLAELVNTSVMQTMRRSVFTSLTVFVSVLALYIVGVSSIKEFSLPIMIGVVAGGYSSIFLSGSFWYMLNHKPEPVAATAAQPAKPESRASNGPAPAKAESELSKTNVPTRSRSRSNAASGGRNARSSYKKAKKTKPDATV